MQVMGGDGCWEGTGRLLRIHCWYGKVGRARIAFVDYRVQTAGAGGREVQHVLEAELNVSQ